MRRGQRWVLFVCRQQPHIFALSTQRKTKTNNQKTHLALAWVRSQSCNVCGSGRRVGVDFNTCNILRALIITINKLHCQWERNLVIMNMNEINWQAKPSQFSFSFGNIFIKFANCNQSFEQKQNRKNAKNNALHDNLCVSSTISGAPRDNLRFFFGTKTSPL